MSNDVEGRRLRISVCVATYNGEQFLAEQLASIVDQLDADDELLLIDDGSSDDSVGVARRALADAHCRVAMLVLPENIGHVRAFETALSAATREILMLADQDDVWLPGYVAKVRGHFSKNPGTGLLVARPVFCDAQLREIDAKNERYRHPRFGGLLGVVLFLLNRSMPIGCTMSLRREDLTSLLPFPAQAFAHDHWIYAGVTLRGRTRALNHPALLYRRHDNVVTVKRSPKEMIATRLRLIVMLTRSRVVPRSKRPDVPVMVGVLAVALSMIAFLGSFLVPPSRGLPVGTRQIRQYIPDVVANLLGVGARFGFAAVILLSLALLVRDPSRALRSPSIAYGVALMGAAVAIGIVRGALGESELGHALGHGQFVIAYVVVLGMPSLSRFGWQQVVAAMRIVFTIPAALSILVLLLNTTQQPEWYTTILPTGTSFGGVACLLWWAHARTTRQLRHYGLAWLAAFGVLISSLRGWILALFVGCAIFALSVRSSKTARAARDAGTKRSWRSVVGASTITLMVAAAVLQLPLSTVYREKYIDRTIREFSGDSLRARQLRNLLKEWADSPLFGSGLGYRNPDLARVGIPIEVPRPYIVELSYFNFLAKMGLVGFGLLIGGLGVLLWHLRSHAKSWDDDSVPMALFAGTLYLLLTSIANPVFESLYVHLFISLTLLGTLTHDDPLGPHWSMGQSAPALTNTIREGPHLWQKPAVVQKLEGKLRGGDDQ